MSALREILAKFGFEFDTAALKKGEGQLDSVIDKVKGFAGALGAGLALGAISSFVVGLTEEADALAKQAATLGVSIGALQEWQFAAKMSGIEAETLNAAIARLSGGKFDPKAMKELGVQTKDARGEIRPTTELLEDVAEKLKGIENPAQRNQLAMGVLGKSYAKLMPLLLEGKDGIQKLRKEFQELGGGFTEEFAQQADEFGDNIDRMKYVWKNLAITVVSSVLPTLLMLSTKLLSVVKPLVNVLRSSKAVQAGLMALALKGVLVLSRTIGPLGAGLKALAGHTFKTIIPLLLLEDLLTFLSGGDSLFGEFLDKAFGAGTAKQVRDWVEGVWKDFRAFIFDLEYRPEKIADDWHVLTSQIRKDLGPLAEFAVRFGQSFVMALGWIKDGFLAAWDTGLKFGRSILMVFGWIGSAGEAAINGLSAAWRGMIRVAESVRDAFKAVWNDILRGASNTLGVASKVLSVLPGTSSIVSGIESAMRGLSGSAAGDLSKGVDSLARDNATTPLTAVGSKGTTNNVEVDARATVHVTVPPGTPEQTARRVGEAAQGGVDKSNRAAYAALVPGRG